MLGNTVVLKPSPYTPLACLRLAALAKSCFPPGVFNVVTGDDKAAFNVGGFLTAHRLVRKVSFTGSTRTGQRVMAEGSKTLKDVTLEMGGNDPAIILADCDPVKAAPKVFTGAFGNSGQICCAIKRLYVHESLYETFSKELVKCCAAARVGNGLDEGVSRTAAARELYNPSFHPASAWATSCKRGRR